ncbi:Fic family protein [Candidatus Electrothrix aarhusensis]|uniref:Fic family protein n=1 Tax=Candidatus Electrothrix aarhusensis TaxID=1859131 RepID=A0A3S3QCI7_9BACT|nr:Fic family protein [Candidatus Electrothrix aarhusensis]
MPRRIAAEELNVITHVIAEHPQGLGISALEKALFNHLPHINRRALQRRLKRLQGEERIITEGESIALRYKPAPALIVPAAKTVQDKDDIPVSSEGKLIRDLVRQPLIQRKPAGYHRSFLEEYEPGRTFYLSKALRAQFHEIGRTSTGERPAGTYARDILNRLLIDLSWSSSRLEGNTYNRLDTEKLISFGQKAAGKDLRETQMILNHKAAIEMLIEEADQVGFNTFTFLNLHALLSENLLPDEDASGRLRRRPVDISGSVFHPLAMPQVIEDCFRLLLQKAAAIPDPFEQAFFIMVQLPYLQPFEDVNKRVSRLGANIPLICNNLCPLSFIDVPEQAYIDGTLGVYEFNQLDLLRDVFTWAYERSCQRYLAITQTVVEPDPLRIQYREALIQAVQAVVRGQKRISSEDIQQLIDELVLEKDKETFKTMLLDSLERLHEGNVARYRLKLSEFQGWKKS